MNPAPVTTHEEGSPKGVLALYDGRVESDSPEAQAAIDPIMIEQSMQARRKTHDISL
jgi:hypothetical protein